MVMADHPDHADINLGYEPHALWLDSLANLGGSLQIAAQPIAAQSGATTTSSNLMDATDYRSGLPRAPVVAPG